MPVRHKTVTLSSPQDTAALAVSLGENLARGDTVLLDGPVGSGKTHFARHLIQSILVEAEDVPSPTFTVVQTYDTTAGSLWHCDLYRIGSTLEIEELGLAEAFDDAICLVEWPDRLADLAPDDSLHLDFAHGKTDDTRVLTATWASPRWDAVVEKWKTI